MSIQDKIREQVTSSPRRAVHEGNVPQCGFSATTVEILKRCGVTDYQAVDVLDPEIRQGIKEYANWPTIPQLYVNSQSLAGCDILKEMYQAGELQPLHQATGLIRRKPRAWPRPRRARPAVGGMPQPQRQLIASGRPAIAPPAVPRQIAAAAFAQDLCPPSTLKVFNRRDVPLDGAGRIVAGGAR